MVTRKNIVNADFINVIVCAIKGRIVFISGKLKTAFRIKIFSIQSVKHKIPPNIKSAFCHFGLIIFLNRNIEHEAKNRLYIKGKIKSNNRITLI